MIEIAISALKIMAPDLARDAAFRAYDFGEARFRALLDAAFGERVGRHAQFGDRCAQQRRDDVAGFAERKLRLG